MGLRTKFNLVMIGAFLVSLGLATYLAQNIAIENAQLYRQTQELAVVHERERFGMALHDGIMQQVYATGLSLQEADRQLPVEATAAKARVTEAIENLSQVLRDLRNYILGLRTGRYQGQDLASSLAQMTRELHANTLMNVNFDAPPRASAPSTTRWRRPAASRAASRWSSAATGTRRTRSPRRTRARSTPRSTRPAGRPRSRRLR